MLDFLGNAWNKVKNLFSPVPGTSGDVNLSDVGDNIRLTTKTPIAVGPSGYNYNDTEPLVSTIDRVYGPAYDPRIAEIEAEKRELQKQLDMYGAGGGFGIPTYQPNFDYFDEAMKAYQDSTAEWRRTIEEYEKTLPDAPDQFSFDRELARQQILKPKDQGGAGINEYYSGLLTNFLTEQEAKIREYGNEKITSLGDLQASREYQTERVNREVQDAISRNEMGLASRGLLDSTFRGVEEQGIRVPAEAALSDFLRRSDVDKYSRIRQAVETLGTGRVLSQGIATQGDIDRAYQGLTSPTGSGTGISLVGAYDREIDREKKNIEQGKLSDIEQELNWRESTERDKYNYTTQNEYARSLAGYNSGLSGLLARQPVMPRLSDYL